MTWQDHFSFKIVVTGPFGKSLQCEQELHVPNSIPLDQLLSCKFSEDVLSAEERKELSLNHRKILWAYEHISKQQWLEAAKDLVSLIRQHPAHTLTIKTSHAGVGVVLAMVEKLKLPQDKKINFYFESAPLAWLEDHFAPIDGSHQVEFAKTPTCAWSQYPSLTKRTRRAA